MIWVKTCSHKQQNVTLSTIQNIFAPTISYTFSRSYCIPVLATPARKTCQSLSYLSLDLRNLLINIAESLKPILLYKYSDRGCKVDYITRAHLILINTCPCSRNTSTITMQNRRSHYHFEETHVLLIMRDCVALPVRPLCLVSAFATFRLSSRPLNIECHSFDSLMEHHTVL